VVAHGSTTISLAVRSSGEGSSAVAARNAHFPSKKIW
jgi:hypothetical protein